MKFYKATDKNMQCRGYQFVLGEWSDPVEGELRECANGYHFCTSPSGVWAYYTDPTTRVFECEISEDDCIISTLAGADAKSVCRRIKLVREIPINGNRNTGNYNTGRYNFGNSHTGEFGFGEAPSFSFGKPIKKGSVLSIVQKEELWMLLNKQEKFNYSGWSKGIPNATPKRVQALHEAIWADKGGVK